MKKRFSVGTPMSLQKIALQICKRFCIDGLCDPMYICNTIAYAFGMGDGNGSFSSETIPQNADYVKAAKYLQNAYGCNIAKSEISELSDIIRTGKINYELAIEGLRTFIKERKQERTQCDNWRKDYLKKTIDEATATLYEFNMKAREII